MIDPAVPGADYSFGRILADAYPEQIQEIWKLYTGSVTGGGSIMNLNAVRADAAGACRSPRSRQVPRRHRQHAHGPAAAGGDGSLIRSALRAPDSVERLETEDDEYQNARFSPA